MGERWGRMLEADLPGLLHRITRLANESTDTPRTLRTAAQDVATTTGLELVGVRFPPGPGAPGDPWTFPVTDGADVVATLSFRRADGGDGTPPPALADTMAAIGHQLGIVVERDRAREALRTATAELERSNRELEQFAYVASHDLQEPLRKVVGFSELLETRYADRLDGEAAEFLGYVTEGARRMARLIEDLLRYSRVGRTRPRLRATDLGTVLAAVLDVLTGRISDAAAEITVDALPTVLGDPDQLRDLLTNLVGNALKYHDETPAHIHVSAEPHADGWWAVTVADDGIGIDPAHAERIFEVFQRLHPRTRYEGSGIGLAICRRIVDHHGGRIWVESQPGQGARFTFTVPHVQEDDDD